MVPQKHKKFESQKRNRQDMIESCLRAQNGSKYYEACCLCQLNCKIARNADKEHWANKEKNLTYIYDYPYCPKKEPLTKR